MAKESHKIVAARHGIIYVMGQLIGSVAIFLTLIVLARQLQPTDLGLYAIAIAFYTIAGIFSTFSMGSALRKKLAENRGEKGKMKLIASAYAVSLIVALVIGGIGVAISGFAAVQLYHQPAIQGALIVAALLAVGWALFNITISVLVGIGRVKESAIVDVVYSVIQLIAAPLLVILGYGVMGAVAGLGIGLAAGIIIGVAYILRDIKIEASSIDKDTMKEIIGFSIPVFISALALQGAYNLGILLLGTFASASVVGNYNVAYKLGSLFVIVINSLVFILLPTYSKVTSRSPAKNLGAMFNRSLYFTVLILAPIVAIVAATSKPIIYLFFTKSYYMAPPYLAIMAVGIVLGVIWNYANVLFLGKGDTKSVVKYQLAAAAIQVGLLAVLTPLFGVIGMIAGLFVISPIIINCIYAYVIRKKLSIKIELAKVYRVAVAGIILLVLLYFETATLHGGYLAIPLNVLLALIIYPPLVAALGGLTKRDVKSLRAVFGDKGIGSRLEPIFVYAHRFAK